MDRWRRSLTAVAICHMLLATCSPLLVGTMCRCYSRIRIRICTCTVCRMCVVSIIKPIPRYQVRRDIFPLSHHCSRHGSSGGRGRETKTKRSEMRSRKVSLQSTKVNNKILFVFTRNHSCSPSLYRSPYVGCCLNVHSSSIFQLWLSILFPHKYIIRVAGMVGNGRIYRTQVWAFWALAFGESNTKFIAFTNQCEREKFCPSKPRRISEFNLC